MLLPQHLTVPARVAARSVCAPPAAIAVTPLESPLTATGVERRWSVPLPSWPELL